MGVDLVMNDEQSEVDIKFLDIISMKRDKIVYKGLFGGTTDVVIKKSKTNAGAQNLLLESTQYKVNTCSYSV